VKIITGDIGETLTLAAEDNLSRAVVRLFHPMEFMLAAPIETPEDLFHEERNRQRKHVVDRLNPQPV
jgi:hypothetical protein